ncbi:intradiol ring-cleavage dioxygenase [Actinomadura rudentiformis]|uniref:Intradiol ring-cleavage dioxygenase n=1 Tax=Actinomadura rudentiformis TaxID=359158 RepID=A0A6H9YEB0_9ACTN|nr:intradiol ring-cleavage dioxygenase [Actinomadura rudentiformis]KAB2339649.1 intradiol ring-cleavage dioxygenase [Actinomadura rudentiformis]
MNERHDDLHDRGLAFDLARLRQLDRFRQPDRLRQLDRRAALGMLGGAVLIGAVGCADDGGSGGGSGSRTSATAGTTTTAATGGGEIPDETAGPFPGDGTNGPNALTESGIVRRDIRSSFGSSASRTVAQGVPLTIELTVTDNGTASKGAAVYVWHCDRDGNYSMYSEAVTKENYLRGVQAADASGVVRFVSIFPAAYSGRWPHIHFEVFSSLAEATRGSKSVKTSQLAFPEDTCKAVYATSGYSESVSTMARTSLEDDMVFGDGHDSQMATMTGNVSGGLNAKLAVRL